MDGSREITETKQSQGISNKADSSLVKRKGFTNTDSYIVRHVERLLRAKSSHVCASKILHLI